MYQLRFFSVVEISITHSSFYNKCGLATTDEGLEDDHDAVATFAKAQHNKVKNLRNKTTT